MYSLYSSWQQCDGDDGDGCWMTMNWLFHCYCDCCYHDDCDNDIYCHHCHHCHYCDDTGSCCGCGDGCYCYAGGAAADDNRHDPSHDQTVMWMMVIVMTCW